MGFGRAGTPVAGIEAARTRGVRVGRPLKLSEYQRREAASMVDAGKSRADIAALLGVHVGTLRRALGGEISKLQ